MSFSSVGKASNSNVGSAPTIAVSVGSVQAGDLVWVFAGDDDSQTITSVSDGTSSFTPLTGASTGSAHGRGFYLLSSVATGTVTYTATFNATALFRSIGAWVFRPTSAATFNQQNIGTTTDGTLNSGSITTAVSDVLVVAGDSNSIGLHTSLQIGGVAATDSDTSGTGAIWYRATTGNVSATGTATGALRAVTGIASFSIEVFSWAPVVRAVRGSSFSTVTSGFTPPSDPD